MALVAVVVLDMRRAIDAQLAQAQAQVRREAEREAADLAAALVTEAALAKVPATARFSLCRGELVVPPELGSLVPERVDHAARLDVLGRERLRRAEVNGEVAELLPLLSDAAVDVSTRAWLAVGCAWRAQRAGASADRDAWLARLPADLVSLEPEVAASAMWLAVIGDQRGYDAEAAVRLVWRLPESLAQVFCERLVGAGFAAEPLVQAMAQARVWREHLNIAADALPTLRGALQPTLSARGDHIVIYLPASECGAALDASQALALAESLRGSASAASLVVAPLPADAVPVVAGRLGVVPAAVAGGGRLSGTVGTALLAAALAALCGGASLFAARALRREAQAQRARAEFLTTVTHELKTPLAGVRLVADLLGEGHVDDPGERATWLARLQAEAARLGLLIENVLDLGRLERGERPHAPERLDLGEFVAETAAVFSPLAERDGFALAVTTARDVHAEVDRNSLRQALLNLLDNARKYGRGPLEVGVLSRDAWAVVTVRDHGDGVPPGEREAIFARFVRGRAHAHGSVPGVGLGLHLARAIVGRHGGELRAVDAPGGGACFELSLPLAPEPAGS